VETESVKTWIKSWVKLQRSEKLFRLESLEEELRDTFVDSEGWEGPFLTATLKNWRKNVNSLLLLDEELWRQRSRAIWLKSGDQNTRFFHSFASARRNNKHIWEILDEDGQITGGKRHLKKKLKDILKACLKSVNNPP
jgi:hypothetical protein